MATMTKADVERLLNQTFYSWDTRTLLGHIVGFLEFSEQNISRQRIVDLEKAKDEADSTHFSLEDEYLAGQFKDHLIQGVEYGYDVSLSQQVRYAGLVAFVTTIE